MKEYQSYIMTYNGFHHLAYWMKEYQTYIMNLDG